MAATATMTSCSHGTVTVTLMARYVASPVKAPTAISTSPCENLITSSTPKNSVNPTATMA